MTYNGKEVRTWDDFICEASQVGNYVTESVVDDLLDSLPPLCMTSELAQMGKPMALKQDPDTGEWRKTYVTFRRVTYPCSWRPEAVWEYCGNCFAGESRERWRTPESEAG